MKNETILFAALILSPAIAQAGEVPVGVPSPDKSQYHLFNPTPVELMRDLSTDRPDTTESPYTVDAGHFQVEASFFDYSKDRTSGVRTEVWSWGSLNVKAGLTNNSDLQIVFDSWVRETTKAAGVKNAESGISDLTARLKINLWGNDGGDTALGIMPFVTAPMETDVSNDEWEGGIIVPFAMAIGEDTSLGLMAEVDFVHDEATGDYETEWVHTATVGFGLTDNFGVFIEYAGVAGTADGFDYQAGFNTGFTFAFSENIVADAGVRLGLNDAAEDYGVFTGLTVRY